MRLAAPSVSFQAIVPRKTLTTPAAPAQAARASNARDWRGDNPVSWRVRQRFAWMAFAFGLVMSGPAFVFSAAAHEIAEVAEPACEAALAPVAPRVDRSLHDVRNSGAKRPSTRRLSPPLARLAGVISRSGP